MKNFIALVPFLLASICHAAGGYAPWGDQHWKTPVASVGTLPASGNNVGDVRIETTAFGEYVWNGSSWVAISGGGGGSGLTSINTDTTAAQLLTVGTAGTNFGIVDAGSGSHVFNLPTASASNRGALSSADWSTFNGKQSTLTLGNLTSTPTTNLVVTGGTGSVVGSGSLLTLTGASLVEATSAVLTISGGTNAVLGTGVSLQVKQASTSQSGYLSSTDWNTFNGKGAGTVTGASVVSANGFAGTVATSTTTPAITLSTSITGVLQGNGTAISAATTTGSGSVVLATSPTLVTPNLGIPSLLTLTSATGLPLATGVTGVLPVANGGSGSSTALVVGGIRYGSSTTVEATSIACTSGQVFLSGGTGAPTCGSALTNPMTAASDIIYGGSSGTPTRLANGSNGQFLQSTGGTTAPQWASPFQFYTSSRITTASSSVSGSTFATFSNSPALTFTPTITGTYKVYCNAGIQAIGSGSSIGAVARIFNTTGSATLLSESGGTSGSSGSNSVITVFIQSIYTLTAGTSYVFDIQGSNPTPFGGSGTQLVGNYEGFYMYAERVN